MSRSTRCMNRSVVAWCYVGANPTLQAIHFPLVAAFCLNAIGKPDRARAAELPRIASLHVVSFLKTSNGRGPERGSWRAVEAVRKMAAGLSRGSIERHGRSGVYRLVFRAA